MIQTLLLASSLLVTGAVRTPGGGVGPASANHDSFTQPRVGLSTMADVVRVWGKPAAQRVEKDHAICTWKRDRTTFVLTFNTELDLLVDRRVVKP